MACGDEIQAYLKIVLDDEVFPQKQCKIVMHPTFQHKIFNICHICIRFYLFLTHSPSLHPWHP